MKLWDHEHPYYMNEGCFYESGNLRYYKSWKEFIYDWGKNDIDYNRVHRWDFNEKRTEISFYYVMQRKAYTYSCHVKITEKDHDAIREFLKPHAELNKKLWEGVL